MDLNMVFCDVEGDRGKVGGLGNNLFKIAAALALAKENNVECQLSHWRYDIFENLNFRGIDSNVETVLCNESCFHFSPISYIDNILIGGYFQSEKHFYKHKDFVLECFETKKGILEYIKQRYSHIIEGNMVSVHVRRGDYLTNGGYVVLSEDYYNRAIKAMQDEGVKEFVFFSDNIEWCKQKFNDQGFYFVEGEVDFVDLFLMSMCKHNIIANSSFSWWGAWLNKNEKKTVISPKDWFTGDLEHHSIKDLIPEEWVKV
jgi:hypothetical protein